MNSTIARLNPISGTLVNQLLAQSIQSVVGLSLSPLNLADSIHLHDYRPLIFPQRQANSSSSNTLQLKDNQVIPTGYALNELAVPAQYSIESGYDVVVATPSGKNPEIDPHSKKLLGLAMTQLPDTAVA